MKTALIHSEAASRFDYGPELTTTAHPKAWAGEWTTEITKTQTVKLTSPREDAGIQLVREFRLVPHDRFVGLSCKQTMLNISKETREVCHWGRSFSPGGGICVIPLGQWISIESIAETSPRPKSRRGSCAE